jgi:hypothetical protein
MVYLAIASSFARELTEEQFAETRPTRGTRGGPPVREAPRGPAPRGRVQPDARETGDGGVRRPAAARRPAARGSGGDGLAASAIGRVLSRLVHIRG